MKVTAIYKANNGDVFFEHDGNFEEISKDQQAALVEEAVKLFETSAPVEVEARHSLEPVEHVSYYKDGEFLATAGMHVTPEYSVFQNHIYLHRESEKTENERLAKKVWAFEKSLNK